MEFDAAFKLCLERLDEAADPAPGPAPPQGPAFLLGVATPHPMLDTGPERPDKAFSQHRAAATDRLGCLGLPDSWTKGPDREEQLGILAEAGCVMPPAGTRPPSAGSA